MTMSKTNKYLHTDDKSSRNLDGRPSPKNTISTIKERNLLKNISCKPHKDWLAFRCCK